jgi:DNA-binding NtrC family response regulator
MEKKHILLIENDEEEVDFFANALEETHLDFLCSTARNTEQAIKLLKNVVPDIIFLDVHILKSARPALLKKLKQIRSLCKTPVIMYSNTPDEKIKIKLSNNETASYFHLPGNVQTMASILEYLVQSNN